MKQSDPNLLRIVSESSVGRVRSQNEDHHGEFRAERGLLAIVADGMGGHLGGETASHLAVDSVGEHFESSSAAPEDMLREALEYANRRIFETSRDDASLRGMGTTAVLMLFESAGTWVAHVGDSRAYRLRAGKLEPLTDDHSVVAEMIRRGLLTLEEAAVHPRRNEILRSVGVEQKIAAEVAPVEMLPGDRFLLCSDGLSTMLNDPEICELLRIPDAEDAAKALVEAANDNGGTDNITVQVISASDLSAREKVQEAGSRQHSDPAPVADDGQASARMKSASWPLFVALGVGAGLMLLAALLLTR